MRASGARPLLLVAACCGALVTGVGPARAASGVLLRYHFAPGQQVQYQMVLSIAGSIPVLEPKLSFTERAPFTQTAKTVSVDGSALLVDTFGTATVSMNGQTTSTSLTGASITARLTARGEVLGLQSTGMQGAGGGVFSVSPTSATPTLPASPVTVGSHWSSDQRIALGSLGTLHGVQHYRVLALATTSGHRVATIQGTGTFPFQLAQVGTQASGTAAGVNVAHFDVDAGALLSSHVTLAVHANLGDGGAGAGQATAVALTVHLNVDQTQ
jgi:hypothetical protein